MRLDDLDYIKLVTGTYKRMRSDNKLSTLLAKPTRANIRRECLYVFDNRYRNKDDNILRGFFGPANSKSDFLALIDGSGAEQFRTLNNYLKGETENTDHANLELLAWLIDFRHRPWSLGMEVTLTEEEKSILNETGYHLPKPGEDEQKEKVELEEKGKAPADNIPEKNINKEQTYNNPMAPLNTDLKKKWSKGTKRSVIAALILVLCTGSIYIIWQGMGQRGNCMYWTGDHYEEVPCNEKKHGRRFVPWEAEKKDFRKITRKDTLTEWSIGKIYYISNSNKGDSEKIEYYTEAGEYPEDLKRNVRKLSKYIFEKDSLNRKLLK